MKTAKRLTALLLCLALCVSISGCRYSDVLEQIIYNLYKNADIDPDQNFHPEDNQEDNEEESDDLVPLEAEEEAERQRDETEELSTGEEANSDSGTQLTYNENSDVEQSATVGTTAVEEEPDEDGEEEEEEEQTVPVAADESEEEEEEEPEEEEQQGATVDKTDESDGGEGSSGTGTQGSSYEADSSADTSKRVVDEYGVTVEVEAASSIAAVGSVAIMVMMLGGEDALCATNSDLVNNSLAAQVFPSLSSVPALWSGSGIQALSDSEFEQLLALHPDAVVETTGDTTVTDEQVNQLAENGIQYVTLPRPTSLDNLQTIMTTLAEMMEENYEGTEEIAEAYISWSDSLYSDVSGKANTLLDSLNESDEDEDDESAVQSTSSTVGIYTLYIDGWDSSAYYELSSNSYVALSGTGCAYIGNRATNTCRTVTSFLSYAGVTNAASSYGVTAKTQYFTPLISQYCAWTITGSAANGYYPEGQQLLMVGPGLGNEGFTTLIAGDNETKTAIEKDRDSGTGLWSVYGEIKNADGTFRSDGFRDSAGNIVATQISGDYEVVVNPCGVTNWATGSAESILESAWAAWRLSGVLTESEVRDYISDFYETFYDYTLTSAQIDAILEGE
ncbi:MAG: hypothetical protein LUD69_05530 [Oscillospiraceae bacterium]|nr:hypothetical protein [Oscillospiraceae bacterium]